MIPLNALPVEEWRKVFLINTEAARALARAFQRREVYAVENGLVVFISSVIAQVGSATGGAYLLSKAALNRMARSLAMEFAARKVRVNYAAPALVRTPMCERTEELWDSGQSAQVEAPHPLGNERLENVANAVAFHSRKIRLHLLYMLGRWTEQ